MVIRLTRPVSIGLDQATPGSDQTGVVKQQAVFDGFHSWKHAVRFGFPLAGAVSDDRAGLEQLVAALAPDLLETFPEVEQVSSEELARHCGAVGLKGIHHTRVMAWGIVPEQNPQWLTTAFRSAISSVPAILVDGARHPGNLGAVIRVAAAVGCPVVFVLGGVDPWLPEVVRAAAGLHAAVPVVRVESIDRIEGTVAILDVDGDALGDTTLGPGAVLAVGAERHGVSAEVSARAERTLALPMRPGVSSLNLATSVSAALYVHVLKGSNGSKGSTT